jgi:hypothetical protein
VIGVYEVFQSHGADFDQGSETLTLYTNWGTNDIGYYQGQSSAKPAGVLTADLFIDINPGASDGFDYAIDMSSIAKNSSGQQEVSIISLDKDPNPAAGYQTSEDLFKNTGWIYGGRYDNDPQKKVPVNALGTALGDKATVEWVAQAGDSDPDTAAWGIVVSLLNVPDFDPSSGEWSFLWATGDCSNDAVLAGVQPTAVVPLPGALLLLGAGFARLAAYRRRQLIRG